MPYTKEQSRAKIAELVASFQDNEARLKTQTEAQIENNFVRPLFAYLNWNTRNAGLAVADYEFVVQRTDRYGKRPDYVLQLDGQAVLVMDTKQVRLDMHDSRWMNQVYAYAYSTQNLARPRRIDFAILTDFQEFVLLDCTLYAATPQAVGNLRVLDWRYSDYLAHFDKLWELFERENVRQALRTRGTDTPTGLWAHCLSPKKVQANRTPPDKAFLAALDDDRNGWRVRLARDMKKHNPQADGALLTAAVQLLIDRLIFIKALSDREIEEDYLAQLATTVEQAGLAESDTGWFTACRTTFDRLNTFYNGSIFEPRPELEAVAVSNKVVRDILRNLQPENSPYNFAVLPVEILGTIYERFLGRVVRTTEKQVRIEDKPEVRKAGGVYYTPQYIVDYIVQHTVGQLLEGCRTPEDVAQLRILDMACGSGSFLLGAYAALIDWHVRYYGAKDQLTKKDRAAAYYDADGHVRLTGRLKRQILQNNLYGVDIDPQAVEVTRFSLSLKALEDTRREELYEERDLFQQTVLPDLRGNIKCGNSLIGPDYFTGQMFPDTEELRRVNPFDWEHEFPNVIVSGGFDAVIGNPPYIRIQRIAHAESDYLFHTYKSPTSKMDLSLVFLEKGLHLIKKEGRVGFICTSQWLSTNYGKNLRRMLSGGFLHAIVDFGSLPVFQSASTYPAILFLSPAVAKTLTYKRIVSPEQLNLADIEAAPAIPISFSTLTDAPWNLGGLDIPSILDARRIPWRPLRHFGKAYIGTKSGMIEAFVLPASEAKSRGLEEAILYPYAHRGEEIDRYTTVQPGAVIIYPYREGADGIPEIIPENELKKTFPRTHSYLLPFKDQLRKRQDSRRLYATGPDWYRHLRAGSFRYIHPPKLVLKGIAKRAAVGLLEVDTAFDGARCPAIIPENLDGHHTNYLLGILNSRLTTYYLRIACPPKLSGYIEFSATALSQTPIRAINFSDPADRARHEQMVHLVDAMLTLHRHMAAARTQTEQELYQRQIEATDRQIDALVYELYGLTPTEVALVEQAMG